MQFKQGTKVYTSDGKDVGSVDRVVLHPKTKEVTHIVIRKGFLFSEDKIIPLALIDSTADDRVTLRGMASDLDTLLPFEETHYIPLDKGEISNADYPVGWVTPAYRYPPMNYGMDYANYESVYYYPYRSETEKNIPEDSIALKEGAQVISADGQHVGNVKRVFTNEQDDRATHFLISEGLIFKEQKLIPVNWVSEIQEDELHLNVGASLLKKLPEFHDTPV